MTKDGATVVRVATTTTNEINMTAKEILTIVQRQQSEWHGWKLRRPLRICSQECPTESQWIQRTMFLSPENLRQQLLEENVNEAAIQDSKQIMKNEFASLQNQLMLLKWKHPLLASWSLFDLRFVVIRARYLKEHSSQETQDKEFF